MLFSYWLIFILSLIGNLHKDNLLRVAFTLKQFAVKPFFVGRGEDYAFVDVILVFICSILYIKHFALFTHLKNLCHSFGRFLGFLRKICFQKWFISDYPRLLIKFVVLVRSTQIIPFCDSSSFILSLSGPFYRYRSEGKIHNYMLRIFIKYF